ncbi:GD22830 [Drosophila simulans]|uniref:GD22830 n=1 Tax=Drosophila simulans TaxID=7240 RepID=B4Q854_DROSI|nr:GD22830 [Drosophila simulans]
MSVGCVLLLAAPRRYRLRSKINDKNLCALLMNYKSHKGFATGSRQRQGRAAPSMQSALQTGCGCGWGPRSGRILLLAEEL